LLNASERIWRRLEELAQNLLCEERLKGRSKDLCKMHVGNYRVIYYLMSCNIIIIKAGRAFTRSSKLQKGLLMSFSNPLRNDMFLYSSNFKQTSNERIDLMIIIGEAKIGIEVKYDLNRTTNTT